MTHQVTEADLPHLRRCVELATEAVEAGDFPFGSVLVAADGTVLAEDRNQEVTAGDPTRHPEFALARWAAANMPPRERAAATVYTSGEHCPMCAAAHGWVGLGRIVYVTSSEQTGIWLAELGVSPAPVLPLAIREVVPDLVVAGPAPIWRSRYASCTADSARRSGKAKSHAVFASDRLRAPKTRPPVVACVYNRMIFMPARHQATDIRRIRHSRSASGGKMQGRTGRHVVTC